jgi:hypothetical protein
MEMSCQLHAPAALPSGNETHEPVGQEAGSAPESMRTLWRRGKSCWESNPGPPARRYTKKTDHEGIWGLN